ncbi:MAG: uroporphyrinogen decarboxylase [Verrucomicrobia bacterium]|nr:uroporphyrinogen decarboxylase [Verrucomicrobiota bacterium]
MNSRERVLAHLAGRPVDHLPLMPITMHFATDVIGVKYGRYAADHRTLVEAQLRTAEKFDFDYVSCISDPAREAADCGADIALFEDQPPALKEDHALLADKTTLGKLKIPDPLGGGRMTDRVQAAALFKEKVGHDKLIEGWVEGPMAEGADLRGINTIMLDFFDDTSFITDLFEFVTEMEIRFAKAQVEAGAHLIGIGDAAASLIGPEIYHEHVWPREKRMVEAIHAMGAKVRLHICGKATRILDGMGRLGCDIVDLDYFVNMNEGRAKMPGQVILGNIEPVGVLRNGKPAQIAAAVAACHHAVGPRYIVGAGCEVTRDTPEANLRAMCDYALGNRP